MPREHTPPMTLPRRAAGKAWPSVEFRGPLTLVMTSVAAYFCGCSKTTALVASAVTTVTVNSRPSRSRSGAATVAKVRRLAGGGPLMRLAAAA